MITCSAQALLDGLKNAARFACTDDDRPILNTVRAVWRPDGLTLVATDSYIAYRETLPSSENDTGEVFDRAIPLPYVPLLVAALKTVPNKERAAWSVGLEVTDGLRVRLLDASTLTSETLVETFAIDGDDYPDVEMMVDKIGARPARTGGVFAVDKFAAVAALTFAGDMHVRYVEHGKHGIAAVFASSDDRIRGCVVGMSSAEKAHDQETAA